jgi:hypothetical protein
MGRPRMVIIGELVPIVLLVLCATIALHSRSFLLCPCEMKLAAGHFCTLAQCPKTLFHRVNSPGQSS